MPRKPTKKSIISKVVKLKSEMKTDKEILQKIPQIKASTLYKITKSKQDVIQANKAKYIKIIDDMIGDKLQATTIKQCIKAKQPIYNFKGEIVGYKKDYKSRLDAVKYIDTLKQRNNNIISQTQNNTFISKELDKYYK